jgi:GNAT superfamily N-acetyltransferase
VDLVFTHDVEKFAAEAEPLLEARLDCNVMATVVLSLRAGQLGEVAPLFALVRGADGAPVGAAIRTPPWPLLLSRLDPAAVPRLVDRWIELDPHPGGVNGPPDAARAVRDAWCSATGGHSRMRRQEAMHVLEAVIDPPSPAAGALRRAAASEHELVAAWMKDFVKEARIGDAVQGEQMAAAGIRRGTLHVWQDNEPVSALGVHPRVAGVVRIGPVYTPPELRCRGYATTAVAHASRRALDEGAERCMLFTDLANPTSNKIYASVGYRRVGDWEEHELIPAAGRA